MLNGILTAFQGPLDKTCHEHSGQGLDVFRAKASGYQCAWWPEALHVGPTAWAHTLI